MLGRKTTMSIKEFCELQRGELSISEIKDRRRLEKRLNDDKPHVLRDITDAKSCGIAILTWLPLVMRNNFAIPKSALVYASIEAFKPKTLSYFLNNIITNAIPISISILILISIYQILEAKDDKEVLGIIFKCLLAITVVYFAPSIVNTYIYAVGRYLK